MLKLEVVQGSKADWVLAAIARDGSAPTGFLSNDTLSATVWAGQDQASLFSPTVSWNDYTSGLVNLSISSAQTATLDQLGNYHLQVSVTRSGTTTVIVDCQLKILPTAGSSTSLVTPYCSYRDLLRYAPWIPLLQDDSADQESYYPQRLEARNWLDQCIVKSWRGTSQAYFGDSGRAAQFWMGGWVRRTKLQSQWLMDKLSGGYLGSVTVTSGGSGYDSNNPPAVTVSGGGGSGATASANVSGGQVVSIYVSQSGRGYTSTPTITIAAPSVGSTATATAVVATGALLIREDTIRITAYKAASIIGMGQIGRQHTYAQLGTLFRDMASQELGSYCADLDLNGDGIGDFPVPCDATNTVFT
jgi:hypothetical protein